MFDEQITDTNKKKSNTVSFVTTPIKSILCKWIYAHNNRTTARRTITSTSTQLLFTLPEALARAERLPARRCPSVLATRAKCVYSAEWNKKPSLQVAATRWKLEQAIYNCCVAAAASKTLIVKRLVEREWRDMRWCLLAIDRNAFCVVCVCVCGCYYAMCIYWLLLCWVCWMCCANALRESTLVGASHMRRAKHMFRHIHISQIPIRYTI